jgi:nitroreductase
VAQRVAEEDIMHAPRLPGDEFPSQPLSRRDFLKGTSAAVAGAPLDLVYVAHGERMAELTPENRRLFCSVNTGFIGQNVYLYCASAGLATVFRGSVDYPRLARTLRLDESEFVTFAQTVGYPKES